MRNSLLFFFVALNLTACGSLVQTRFSVLPAQSDPQWLINATEAAVYFWDHHGAPAGLGAGGYTVVSAPNIDKEGDWGQCGEGRLYINPALATQPQEATCVVAHEMGHAFGMRHVRPGKSLMAPIPTQDPDATCFWSADDEVEFKHAVETNSRVCP